MISYARLPVMAARSCLAAAMLLAVSSPGFAQVRIDTHAMELEFSGRLQFQAQTTSCTTVSPPTDSACGSEQPDLDMIVRRARVSVEATIDDRLSFKLEPDFATIDGVRLKDAWGRFAFSDAIAFRAGHFKRPFDGFELTSSSLLPFERAVIVPGVPVLSLPSYTQLTALSNLSAHDIGFTFEGAPADGLVKWWLGMFTGNSDSQTRDTNPGKQFIGRVQVNLDAGTAPLSLAGAVAITDAPYTATDGETVSEHYSDFELFAQLGGYDRDGLLVQAGLVGGGSAPFNPLGGPLDLAAGDDIASMLTWQGVVAYRIPVRADWLEGIAPHLRVTYGDPSEAPDDEATSFSPGLSLYFYGRNRLALTWDIATFAAEGVNSENSFKAQMQFYF